MFAECAANIPVGSGIYADLERLEVKGLIESGFLSTKPFSHTEGLRLLKEAERKIKSMKDLRKSAQAERVLKRIESALKLLNETYARLSYSDGDIAVLNFNNKGDVVRRGLSLRTGFSSTPVISDTVVLYINPEYRADREGKGMELVHGYVNLTLGGAEFLVGRDSQWWGAGYHGSLLMSDNPRPFDMIKVSSAHPFVLPWVLGYLGAFRPVVFLTRLEQERDFPRANILGMRLDFKPTPGFQFGLNRVFMFGGEGRPELSAFDWFKIFVASDSSEHADSPTNGNQIASIDASIVYVNDWELLPFSGVKLYTEWGAEDSSGDTKTPTGRANIYGAYIDGPLWLKYVDLRVEWANTGRNVRYGPSWYKHTVYTTGYTYEGRVIGHHIGADANDLFARAQYHSRSGIRFGAEYDGEVSDIHSVQGKSKKDWFGADIYYPVRGAVLSGGVGREESRVDGKNYAAWIEGRWLF